LPTILLTNDDGIDAPGLNAARSALVARGTVITVAPDRERSGAAHAITLTEPLRIRPLPNKSGWCVAGTPTDCVNLALNRLLAEPPVLVVSGINRGSNVGDDVSYSGTVCAALEGALHGVPSLAVSMAWGGEPTNEAVRRTLLMVVDQMLARELPARTVLNLNFPAGPPLGLLRTSQGNGGFRSVIHEQEDPRGGKYYWIGGKPASDYSAGRETDVGAVKAGYASLTPLRLDMTCRATLAALEEWPLEPLE
jgi:5'-nucleotidase